VRLEGGGGAVWAFVAAAGLGIPIISLPPIQVAADGDDSDEDMLTSGGIAWAISSFRSVRRMCSITFLQPPSTSSSTAQEHIISSSISWRETWRSRRCIQQFLLTQRNLVVVLVVVFVITILLLFMILLLLLIIIFIIILIIISDIKK
jgi:hypothetical protein